MSDVVIGENATIEYSIIDENTKVGANAIVGNNVNKDKPKITVLGRNIVVDDGALVEAGKIIDNDVKKEEN